MENNVTRDDLIRIGFDWFRQQFRSSRDFFPKLFTEVTVTDYLALHFMVDRMNLNESKVYLKEIAAELMMPMQKLSPMVHFMQDRGMVYWKHDKKGTYITISEEGMAALNKQQQILTDFIEKCVSEYGYDKLATLVRYRSEFNDTMEKVLSDM